MNWTIYALIFATAISWASITNATDNLSADELAADFLADLNLIELQEIEVSLDDAFDIFDGLVKTRRTKVASGVKQSVERAPSITSVITAQDIEAMGARTINEVLQTIPGIQMSQAIFFGEMRYTVRGLYSHNMVLILLNGIRVNLTITGDIAVIPAISMIERIEVIRGPGSALYGADAFAGVINIITKAADDVDGTEVGVRAGNYNSHDIWVQHGSEVNGFDIGVMLDFAHTDGHQRIIESDAQTVLDKAFGTNASLAPGPFDTSGTYYNARVDIAKQHWHLRAGAHKLDHRGMGAGAAQALDPSKSGEVEFQDIDLTYHNPTVTNDWGIKARVNFWNFERASEWHLYPPGAFGGAFPIGMRGYPASKETQSQFKLSGTYRGWQQHLLRVGVGYAYYDLDEIAELRNFGIHPYTGEPLSPLELYNGTDTPAAYMPEVARESYSIFVQDTWTLNPYWELTAGIRYDHYSDFGSTTNPRLGLVWEARDDLTLKLLYGSAFLAPNFQQLYNSNNPSLVGAIDLKPEQIKTWELGLDYRLNTNMHLALNLFRFDIEDKISSITTGAGTTELVNADTEQGQGGELELRWKTSAKSSLLFNYSYQDSENAQGERLSYASEHAVYIRADYLLGSHWYLDTQLNWMSDWIRAAHDPRPDMDGYTTVDLTLRRKDIRKGKTNFAIGIRNLFDADVRYPSPSPSIGSDVVNIPNDLPGAGRSYFIEFRYKF